MLQSNGFIFDIDLMFDSSSIAKRRNRVLESQAALSMREKEVDEKERRLIDMIHSKASDDERSIVIQNLSSGLAAERRALAHRWSIVDAELRSITSLEHTAFSAACDFGRKLTSAPEGQGAMTRDMDVLSTLNSDPRLQTSYCAIWSVQQIQLVSLAQQQQQADMPCFSCCFQR